MRCLYCGKEVGFLQELKDGEFCSKSHRGRYLALTRRGLARLLEPETKRSAPVEERDRRREGPGERALAGFRPLRLTPLPIGERQEIAEFQFLRQLVALAAPPRLNGLATASGKGLPRALNPLVLQLPTRGRPAHTVVTDPENLLRFSPILPAHVTKVTALPLSSAPPRPVTVRADAGRPVSERSKRKSPASPKPYRKKTKRTTSTGPGRSTVMPVAMGEGNFVVPPRSPVRSKAVAIMTDSFEFSNIRPVAPGLYATVTQALHFAGPVTAGSLAPISTEQFPLAYREISMEPSPPVLRDSGLGVVGGLARFTQPPPRRGAFDRWKDYWRGVPGFVPVAVSLTVLFLLVTFALPIERMNHTVESRWAMFAEGIANRAAVDFAEDFHSGFEAWEGSRDWDRSWSVRREGYVHPGRLAIYTPSAMLTDYRLEFFGQIDRKGISWAYRAADLENYYVARVVVKKAGLRPTLALVRYAVVDGKKTVPIERPLRLLLHNDTPYRFTLTATGNRFSISAAGVELDSWTDATLRAGGVGFFTEKGERSRIYWMRLAYQDDLAGRLCRSIIPAPPLGFLTNTSR